MSRWLALPDMIVCNLTKPEATQEQVRKTYPKLGQTDVAQLSVALVLAGKYALAHYDGETYRYPEDVTKFTKALSVTLNQIQSTVEPTKKAKAAAAEEEPVEVKVGLSCNIVEGEHMLGDRKDLKALLGEAVKEGVEYQYTSTDILWQWALDRANWTTISGGELTRRVKLKAAFEDSTLGTELGVGGKVKKTRSPKAAAVVAEAAAGPEAVDIEEALPE
ncbi:MAG: hypothetical protein IT206_02665 [Fimbriimonadaceae bacterium]|nr:hypothetical protein [Fimbriimonadaceae bacterium]